MVAAFLLAGLLFQQPATDDPLVEVRAALGHGDLEAAEKRVREVIETEAANGEAYFLLGGILARRASFDNAERAFLQAVRLNPRLGEAYTVLATLYQNQGRLEEATGILEHGLSSLPDSVPIRYQLAQLLMADRQFESSLRHLQRISPEAAPASYWNSVGQCHLLMGNLAGADDAFQKYLGRRPDSVKTLRTLAAVAMRRGETGKAWEQIAQARRLAPNSPQILLDFARISMEYNLIGEAAAALQYLLIMDPNNSQGLFDLGSAFIHFSNFDRSVGLFRQYVRLRPEDARGRAMLGYALFLSSDHDEAQKQFEEALAMDPQLADATFYLGMIALSQSRDQEAERLFREATAKMPQHGRARLNLGKLYLRQRRVEEARVELEEAAQLMPTDFEVHFQLGRVYSALGDRERANEEIRLYEKYSAEKEKREAEARRTPFSNFGQKPPG